MTIRAPVFDVDEPDTRACLGSLRAAGYRAGIPANQPAATTSFDRACELPVDLIAMSEEWGAATAGLVAVVVRRGSWGHVQPGWPPEASCAHLHLESLAELPAALRSLG